ncbi:penicillin-binding protein [Holzapfeliella sp. JNUCC 72]
MSMKPNKNKSSTESTKAKKYSRAMGIFLELVVFLVFVIFALRFVYITTVGKVDGQNLGQLIKNAYDRTLTEKANRGTIYDNNNQVIATDSRLYSIYAVLSETQVSIDKKTPLYVVNKEETAEKLSKVLPASKEQLLNYLNTKNAFQVSFGVAGMNLSLQMKKQIEELQLPGINFTETPSRLYPNGIFASNIVGLTQLNTNENNSQYLTGNMGIEQFMNDTLKGIDGVKKALVDARGYEMPGSQQEIQKVSNGSDVHLTIDSRLQSYLEELLTDTQNKYEPLGMNAILMESKTGKILAASQRPTFNPTTKDNLNNSWRNTLVEDGYEPGSVMKILTLAAAIQNGTYNPNEYYQSGAVNVNGSVIRDWNWSGWGSIPLSQAFPRSSNVGMVKLEQQMGSTVFNDYLKKFQINQKTGITLPGEVVGSRQSKTDLDFAINSFGQGINVTAVQMMQAFSAIANKGQMVKPQIIDHVTNPNTGENSSQYQVQNVGEPVISEQTASQVLSAMKDVVYQNYGTGTAYKVPGFDIAAKTGTAQIANPNGGGYLTGSNNYIFSVVGMAPADDPKYTLYITVKQPQKMTAAAETIMSNVFKPLMTRVLSSTNTAPTSVSVPDFTGKTIAEAASLSKTANVTPVVLGDGQQIVRQSLQPSTMVSTSKKLLLLTNGALTMPDMTGWDKDTVDEFATLTGQKINFNSQSSNGSVTAQSVAKGQALTDNGQITVTLK